MLKVIFGVILTGFVLVIAELLALRIVLWIFETLAGAGKAFLKGDEDND